MNTRNMTTIADLPSTSDISGELLNYIKEKDLNRHFVGILESLLIHKPDNPIGHIVQHLLELYPEETKQYITKAESPAEEVPHVLYDYSDDDSNATEQTVSAIDDVKTFQLSGRDMSRRRASVCAEKLTLAYLEKSEIKHNPKSDDEAGRIRHVLTQNVLFRALDRDQLTAVQNAMSLVEKAEGEVIIQQGEDGDNFYIIDSGSVDVFVKDAVSMDPPGKLVKTCGDGDSFGELAIMYNSPRAATCIAKGPVRLWALDRVSFKVIMMKSTLAKRSQYTSFLKKVPMLSQLTEYELMTVADALQEETFTDDAVVCAEGDVGGKFYVIREGTAICTKKDSSGRSKEVARLSSGSYFGEIALLTSKTRQATVIASDNLICLTLDRRTFTRVMGPLRNILMRNMDEYTKIQAAII